MTDIDRPATEPRTLADLDRLAAPLHARVITREAIEELTRLAYEKGRAEAAQGATPRAEVVLAHCPHCNGDGCDVCYGTGQTEVAAPLSPIGDNLADTIAERRARRGAIPAMDRPATEPRTDAAQAILTGLRGPDFGSTVDEILVDGIRRRLIEVEAEARVHALGEGFVRGVNAEAKAQGAAPLPSEAAFWKAANEWLGAGSGMTREQETGAAMVWSWIAEQSERAAPRAKGLDVDALTKFLVTITDDDGFDWSYHGSRREMAREIARFLSRPSDKREGDPDDR